MRSGTPVEGDTVLESESSIDSHTQPESRDPIVISSSPFEQKKKEE